MSVSEGDDDARARRKIQEQKLLWHLTDVREERLRSVKAAPKKGDVGGGPHPVTMALALAGRAYASAVLDSYRGNHISLNRASDLLGLRIKHFDRLTRDLRE
ncbi:MAG: hypothetical protein AB1758_24305 [Candidatus Eremiobacterota bacterium]